jgi:DNA-binding MarR family transcriptional regulator
MKPIDQRLTLHDGKLRAAAELLDHAMRAIYSQCFSDGLNPAQWSALRYIARANPNARTLTDFARFHFVSKSAASDTISALVRKELLIKRKDARDGRVAQLEITERARQILRNDPLDLLVDALAQLPLQSQDAATELVATVTRSVYASVTESDLAKTQQIVNG